MEKKTVIDFSNLDPRSQPLFLGKNLGLQRYDRLKYPKLFRMAEAQEGFFWRAEEVSLVKDRSDYKSLSPEEKFVFDSNLMWQTAQDSILSRSILEMAKYVSNPELEACMNVWAFFESNIHSRSYSHILKNVYPDESKFWDRIQTNSEIRHRIDVSKKAYDDLFEDDDESLRQRIFNAIVATNVTEGLSFYVSFACSFFFGVNGKMEGNAKIINLIRRDEDVHASITTTLLKIFRDVPEEGFSEIYTSNLDKIKEAFDLALNVEIEWAKYLFSKGNLLGLTESLLVEFAKFRYTERLKLLGIKSPYTYTSNPLGSWYTQFVNPKTVQVAPQETENSAYVIGSRDSSVDLDSFKTIDL